MPTPLLVLHVEDDPDDVELLQRAFEDTGIVLSVKVIKEGNKVMPWLDQQAVLPDVMVLDLNMPKMHGREILVSIKADERLKSIPVVVLSTSSSQDDIKFCLSQGAKEFITKPATVTGFKNAVELILTTANKG